MTYQVKPDYIGKVKLESGTGSILLDSTTSQAVLTQLFDTELGKQFIEEAPQVAVPEPVAVAAKPTK